MLEIPLQKLPRQQLSVTIDGNRWDLRLVTVGNGMAIDITLNEQVLIQGLRVPASQRLLPYRYMQERAGGNFAFYSANDNTEIPWWENFGVTCGLIWSPINEF